MHACGRISVGAWVQLYECVSVYVGNGASPTLNILLELLEKSEKQIIPIDHAPHTVVDIEPGESSNIWTFDAFELTHASLHSVWLKETAE